jgi:putative resolvase
MSMLKLKEVAKILNVHVKTLQLWDRKGIFKAKRTPTNRRYYTEQMLEEFLNGKQQVPGKSV